ncbi:AraC family transcriptional regulator [Sphingopyxis sp. 113P3]|uniref:AraC family transcriptional regulator n=1 Tax=Sphingopyxis sp. (strain 113P3) TaxID=292913 RepID=UPI0006AD3A25|nr:helix-turn-helix transcriptional regulator [Sphingopyxis sp. 113P3]ALC12146.1 AraC family transcriptional regulator [Sphingopyxis sp. 113P3]
MKHSIDILRTARPVMALQDEYPAGFVDPMHSHDHVQILYASSGVMSVRTPETSFVIPPQRAVWMPAGMKHEVACRGPVSLRTLYLPSGHDGQGTECRVFEVSNLLKALILEIVDFPPLYDVTGREGRIIDLLIEEIERMPNAPYQVSMPTDPRLLRVCNAILADPADPRDIDDWAALAAMGRRTFTRSFKEETGMGLAVWRQQVRLMEALSLLAAGASITQVTYDVGYDSPSGFAAMFRRAFGVPPSKYLRN